MEDLTSGLSSDGTNGTSTTRNTQIGTMAQQLRELTQWPYEAK